MFRQFCASRLPSSSRGYAIAVQTGRVFPGKPVPRNYDSEKVAKYSLYTRMLNATSTQPLIILYRNDFSANRLKKLRTDIQTASKKLQANNPNSALPALTVVRSSVFGAALRDFPNLDLAKVEKMVDGVKGGYAVLSLPLLDPSYLKAILRALDKSVPPKPPKTAEEIQKEIDLKNADPAQPGRRMKRVRATLTPDLKVLGAMVEGNLLLPDGIQDVTKLPSLETLRAQIVGLLSAPSTQLAAVLSEASGGKLARTLEGLRQALEDKP